MRKTIKKYLIPHSENDHKPHIFHFKNTAILALVSIVLFGLAYVATITIQKTDFYAAVIASSLVDLANENRLAFNEPALRQSATLVQAAHLKAEDMSSKGYFAHYSPEGLSPWYWFDKVGYDFIYAGENLAVDFFESEAVNRAWMESPSHRANILNKEFTEIGIATTRGRYNGRLTTFVVQMFGKPVRASNSFAESSEEEIVASNNIDSQTQPEVAGISESRENLEVIHNEDMFIAVQDTSVDDYEIVDTGEKLQYSSVFARVLINPALIVNVIYVALGIIVGLALIAMIAIEVRKQHYRNIFYGVLLLVLMGMLFFLNSTLIFSRVIVV